MRKWINICFAVLIIAALYYAYDKLFDIYSTKTIVYVFLGIVALVILYSSLRLCFIKKDK